MLLLASSVVCKRSTSFLREVACAVAGIYRAVFRGHTLRAGDFAQKGSRALADDGAGEEQHPAALHQVRHEAEFGEASAGNSKHREILRRLKGDPAIFGERGAR